MTTRLGRITKKKAIGSEHPAVYSLLFLVFHFFIIFLYISHLNIIDFNYNLHFWVWFILWRQPVSNKGPPTTLPPHPPLSSPPFSLTLLFHQSSLSLFFFFLLLPILTGYKKIQNLRYSDQDSPSGKLSFDLIFACIRTVFALGFV